MSLYLRSAPGAFMCEMRAGCWGRCSASQDVIRDVMLGQGSALTVAAEGEFGKQNAALVGAARGMLRACLVGRVGIEPTTIGLKDRCSATELPAQGITTSFNSIAELAQLRKRGYQF